MKANFNGKESVFAIRLRGLLKENNTSQGTLAKIIGVAPQTVSLYVQGQSNPPFDKLLLIAENFGVSIDYLLGNSDIKPLSPDLDMIQKYTGLSFQAIKLLHNEKEMTNKKPEDNVADWSLGMFFLDFINQLLASEEITGEAGIIYALTLVKIRTSLIDNGDQPSDPLDPAGYINAGKYKASYEFSKFLEKYFKPDAIKADIIRKKWELLKFTETKEGLFYGNGDEA